MRFKKIPSQTYLQSVLSYDHVTGIFTWKIREDVGKRWRARHAGNVAGQPHPNGYWNITLNYSQFRAHRLAWVYVYGTLPENMEIDHINGNRRDNRISNLRLASKSQNMANSAGKSRCGLPKGVERNKARFTARIMVAGARQCLGTYDTPAEASAAYADAARRLSGEFARVN